jgi:hypothetical protein
MHYIDYALTLWLIQFYPIYIKYYKVSFNFASVARDEDILMNMEKVESAIQKCNFTKLLNNCISNYNNKPSEHERPFFENADNEINISYAQMVFIFFIPVVCAFGIFTNTLVIKTIPLIKKDKEFKDKRHYDYMRINALANCCLFLIKIIGLINECTAEFWCSQIHRLVGVQYYKLIFDEMLATSLRFFSNFTYVAFLLCRLSHWQRTWTVS